MIVFHTLRSLAAPHRLLSNKECYIRRGERCETLTMREIHDLTLRANRQMEEGLWTAQFGSTQHQVINGGVVVLEAGRLFGGDASHYYEGRYERFDNKIHAEFRVVHYFGSPATAWGDTSPRFTAIMEGERKGEVITGKLSRPDMPGVFGDIIMQRRTNLP